MILLEVGNFGGDSAELGLYFLILGVIVLFSSVAGAIILGISSAANPEKKYDFKPVLYGVLLGFLIFIAGGCICGFQL